MKVVIGTSGYSYEDWREVFYPAGLPKGNMLEYYARHFNCVEINSSYYRIPHPSILQRMSDKTPTGFEFIVKVHQSTTHERIRTETPLKQMIEAVQPLVEVKKFSGFLAQFPYSFKNTPENRDYLSWVKDQIHE